MKFNKIILPIVAMNVGGIISSLLITGSDNWKYYLVVVLLIYTYTLFAHD